ncbi:MAG: stage II sporulation protein P [Oscillospiraceae bacterium]|nr:stage II sporulation protein P [Oscillospiraceae bacterium]
MKGFFQKFILLAAFAVVLRIIFSPATLTAAQTVLRELGTNERFTAALLGGSLPEPDSAVISSESAAPATSPQSKKPLMLKSDATQTALFHTLPADSDADEPAIKNKTSFEIDTQRLLAEPLTYTLKVGTPQVLILHTHGSEAYSQEGGAYEETDVSRTTDTTKNVVQVGEVLTRELSARGLTVIHDCKLYDYPSYSGSYSRSLDAVEEYLRKYPTIKVIIDLHRDSATSEDGTVYRTEYITPDGKVSSQLMLIAATGEAGLSFPNWKENMKLALRLQQSMAETHPGLARPILVSDQRYNQHAAPGYLLLEVGTDGNTLAEAETAARLFAHCMADVLGEIVE